MAAVADLELLCAGERAAAEDLAADAFVRAWTARDRIRHETVRAYLLTITRNAAVEWGPRNVRVNAISPGPIETEMLEAAAMDGANLPRILRQVVAPVVMPGIAATALICFIFSWNELLFARVLTATVAETAPVFLTSFVTSQGLFLAKVCAAALVVSLPVLIAGFAAQDKLVQGLSLGAVK